MIYAAFLFLDLGFPQTSANGMPIFRAMYACMRLLTPWPPTTHETVTRCTPSARATLASVIPRSMSLPLIWFGVNILFSDPTEGGIHGINNLSFVAEALHG